MVLLLMEWVGGDHRAQCGAPGVQLHATCDRDTARAKASARVRLNQSLSKQCCSSNGQQKCPNLSLWLERWLFPSSSRYHTLRSLNIKRFSNETRIKSCIERGWIPKSLLTYFVCSLQQSNALEHPRKLPEIQNKLLKHGHLMLQKYCSVQFTLWGDPNIIAWSKCSRKQ